MPIHGWPRLRVLTIKWLIRMLSSAASDRTLHPISNWIYDGAVAGAFGHLRMNNAKSVWEISRQVSIGPEESMGNHRY